MVRLVLGDMVSLGIRDAYLSNNNDMVTLVTS